MSDNAWAEFQQWLMMNVGSREAEECSQIVRKIGHYAVVRGALHAQPELSDDRLIGILMQATGGTANPNEARTLIDRCRRDIAPKTGPLYDA